MGKLGPNEFLLRLAKDSGASLPQEFSRDLGLTSREGEVLSWLSKGKTNRDIAQILGLSPRTVDKHLEQIVHEARRREPHGSSSDGGQRDASEVVKGSAVP